MKELLSSNAVNIILIIVANFSTMSILFTGSMWILDHTTKIGESDKTILSVIAAVVAFIILLSIF